MGEGCIVCVVKIYSFNTLKISFLQGYHDVAVTLLLVNGEELATALLEQISLHQLRCSIFHQTLQSCSFLFPAMVLDISYLASKFKLQLESSIILFDCCFRDFMDLNMERTSQMLALIHAIIEAADVTLERFLRR